MPDGDRLWHWDDDAVFAREAHPSFKQKQLQQIETALATGDAETLAEALLILAQARGMSEISRRSGLLREGLYRMGRNPKLGTVLKVMQALDIKLTISD